MSASKPVLNQLNLVVRDMDASLAFYRRLGLEIREPFVWPPGSGAKHADVEMPNGMHLEFDNLEMARIWNRGCSSLRGAGSDAVIGFAVATREAVDELYADLVGAGYSGRQAPYDAFWGARYAIVDDPDGNQVGLMSPKDPARQFTPKA